jgi:thiol-disulfide isomerase/thioredoxin
MNNRSLVRASTLSTAATLLACMTLLGCGPKATRDSIAGTAPVDPIPTATGDVALSAVDRAGYDAVIAKHRGKVVLVDFWATWCSPCVEQLPHTLALGQQMSDRGLMVVTVSCDEPTESDRVAKFLSTQQASGATNLISQFGGSPRTMDEFEIASGAVPFYKLYDRAGRLRQSFGIDPAAKKQFTSADIEAAVEQLLAEPG